MTTPRDENAPSGELPTTDSRRIPVAMSLEREVEGLEREVDDIKRRLREGDRQLANLRTRDESLATDIAKAQRDLERAVEQRAKVEDVQKLESAIDKVHDAASPRISWSRIAGIVLVVVVPILTSLATIAYVAGKYPDRSEYKELDGRLRAVEIKTGGKSP